jgi:hypothetical protein
LGFITGCIYQAAADENIPVKSAKKDLSRKISYQLNGMTNPINETAWLANLYGQHHVTAC